MFLASLIAYGIVAGLVSLWLGLMFGGGRGWPRWKLAGLDLCIFAGMLVCGLVSWLLHGGAVG